MIVAGVWWSIPGCLKGRGDGFSPGRLRCNDALLLIIAIIRNQGRTGQDSIGAIEDDLGDSARDSLEYARRGAWVQMSYCYGNIDGKGREMGTRG